MLLELAIAATAGYGLLKLRPAPKKLVTVLAPPAPTRLETFKTRYINPFLSDSRQSHQEILRGKTEPISLLEQQAKRQFLTSSLAVGLAVMGATLNVLFYLPALYLVSLKAIDVVKRAWHTVTIKKKFSGDVTIVIFFIGMLGGGYFLGFAVTSWFYTLVTYLTVKTEDHSKRSLVHLFGEQPRFVWIWVDGVEVQIPFEQVEIGQIIMVQAGETIPVDGIITEGVAMIDQHLLTGEAQAIEKTVGESVFMATVMLSGRLQIRVERTGQHTVAAQVGQILNQTLDFKETLQSRAIVWIDQIALPLVALSGVTWAVLGLSPALGVLMAYPGYRLLFLNPLSMLGFLHIASEHGILVKDGRSLELLNEVDTIVFDKTGTLTLDQPHVSQIHAYNNFRPAELLRFAAIAEHKQSHPIAQAILQAAQAQNLELPPIDAANYQIGFGITVTFQGQTIRVGSQRFMAQEGIAMLPEFAAEQLRCHHLGHHLVMVACNETFMGALELQSTLRPEAQHVTQQLKARGFKLVIISGDHEAPTQYLAESLGIESYYAQVLPKDKATLVARLEAEGRKVCFVGDGINDAIALKKATSSISLRGATTIATDTAQIVLMDAHLEQLVQLFDLAKQYDQNIKFNFKAATIPNVVYIGGAYLFGWGFITALVIQQLSSLLALYNVMQPLLDEGKRKAITSQ